MQCHLGVSDPIAVKLDDQDTLTNRTHSLSFLYHELRRERSDYSYVLCADEFGQHVDLFAEIQRSGNSRVLPEITFDDGHISNVELALPILQLQGLHARFFITVGWIGQKQGYMSWQDLRTLLDAGQQIGAHGWTHTLLTHCNAIDLQHELRDARLALEDKLGTSITTMSLPGGRYNYTVLSACVDAGYTQVFSSIPRAETLPIGALVGRLNVLSGMTLEWISTLLKPESVALAKLERHYRIKAAGKRILGDKLYERVWALVNRQEKDTGEAPTE